MRDVYRDQEAVLAANMADRADWGKAIRHLRQLAVAADAELRRRHPGQPWPPMRSAEPQLSEPDQPARPDHAQEDLQATQQLIRSLAARNHEFAVKLAERQTLMIPAEVPDLEASGYAFPAWPTPDKDAILQPPQPHIPPSRQILELAAERDLGREPGG